MADTATAGIQTPAQTATVTESDLAKLNAILDGEETKETETAAPAASTAPAAPAATTATTATPETKPAEPPEPTSEQLKQLDELLNDKTPQETTPDKPAAPAAPSTPEVAQLQQWMANPEHAKEAVNSTFQMIRLQQAASSGDVQGVLNEFHPNFVNAMQEQWYQQNKEALVKRFIAEHEGTIPKPDPRIDALSAELEELKNARKSDQDRQTQLQKDWEKRQADAKYNDWWNEVFKAVGVTDKKTKSYLRGATLDALAEDARDGSRAAQTAIQQIQRGDYKALGLRFRDTYVDYIGNVKTAQKATEEKRQAQEEKKNTQLATGSQAATQTNTAATKEPDFDEDGKRTPNFLARGMKKLGLLDD